MSKIIYLKPMGEFPCYWDDLVTGRHRTVVATVYTRENAKEDGLEPGITRGDDGLYDIVIDVPELTAELVSNSLKELSRIAGREYRLKI